MQVHADHVPQLLHEVRVLTELERFDAMRLQPVRLPDAMHDAGADALRLGHRPHTPVRRIRRRRVQRGVDDRLNFLGRHGLPPSGTRRVFQQPCDAGLLEPLPPQIHGRATDAEIASDRIDRSAVGRGQDDARARDDALGRLAAPHQGLNVRSLRRTQGDGLCRVPHTRQDSTNRRYCKSICGTLH